TGPPPPSRQHARWCRGLGGPVAGGRAMVGPGRTVPADPPAGPGGGRRRPSPGLRGRPLAPRGHVRLTARSPMAWNNPPIPWSEFARRLSGGRPTAEPPEGDRDGAAWSRRRQPYRPPADLTSVPSRSGAAYAEL